MKIIISFLFILVLFHCNSSHAQNIPNNWLSIVQKIKQAEEPYYYYVQECEKIKDITLVMTLLFYDGSISERNLVLSSYLLTYYKNMYTDKSNQFLVLLAGWHWSEVLEELNFRQSNGLFHKDSLLKYTKPDFMKTSACHYVYGKIAEQVYTFYNSNLENAPMNFTKPFTKNVKNLR